MGQDAVASVSLYVVGSSRADECVGGWGAVLVAGKGRKTLYGGHCGANPSDDLGEDCMALRAAAAGLACLTLSTTVSIYTASTYVADIFGKWLDAWSKNGWKTKTGEEVPNQDFLKGLVALVEKHNVTVVVVPEYSGGGFEDAAELARQGIDERLDEARTSTSSAPVVPEKPVMPVAEESIVPPGAKNEKPESIPLAPSDPSEVDALKALLRECLPVLCSGLSLGFLKKNDPNSLAARVAVATE